jgi:hypothetical protein
MTSVDIKGMNDMDVYNEACERLSLDHMTNNCCAICERDMPKYLTTFKELDDAEFIQVQYLSYHYSTQQSNKH